MERVHFSFGFKARINVVEVLFEVSDSSATLV
jgi:hypothetical protein